MSEKLADLVFFALDHGINSIGEGGPLIPFIVYEKDGKRSLHRYCADTLEESVKQARLAASRLPMDVSACAIAYDGNVKLKDAKSDAIIVEGTERGKLSGIKLAQRYSPKALLRRFAKVGNPLHLGDCKSVLTS